MRIPGTGGDLLLPGPECHRFGGGRDRPNPPGRRRPVAPPALAPPAADPRPHDGARPPEPAPGPGRAALVDPDDATTPDVKVWCTRPEPMDEEREALLGDHRPWRERHRVLAFLRASAIPRPSLPGLALLGFLGVVVLGLLGRWAVEPVELPPVAAPREAMAPCPANHLLIHGDLRHIEETYRGIVARGTTWSRELALIDAALDRSGWEPRSMTFRAGPLFGDRLARILLDGEPSPYQIRSLATDLNEAGFRILRVGEETPDPGAPGRAGSSRTLELARDAPDPADRAPAPRWARGHG